MNAHIEREYIKYLLNENEILKSFKLENDCLKGDLHSLENDLKVKTELLEKAIAEQTRIKKEMKKPVTISNPETFNIFNEIKNGGIIKFITPTINEKYKSYQSNPFIFELDNKMAVFDGELKGMIECKKGNRYWYNVKPIRKPIISEVFKILGANQNFRDDMKIQKNGKRGKNAIAVKLNDILKLNPVVEINNGKFVTTGKTRFVYQHNDGSNYIIKENGEEEVIT